MNEHKNFIMENLENVENIYCVHCERTYKKSQIRYDAKSELYMCHYPDCDGDAFGDAWDYDSLKKGCGWPDVPVMGAAYSLYSFKKPKLYRCKSCGNPFDHWDVTGNKCSICNASVSVRLSEKIMNDLLVMGYYKCDVVKSVDGKGFDYIYHQLKEVK